MINKIEISIFYYFYKAYLFLLCSKTSWTTSISKSKYRKSLDHTLHLLSHLNKRCKLATHVITALSPVTHIWRLGWALPHMWAQFTKSIGYTNKSNTPCWGTHRCWLSPPLVSFCTSHTPHEPALRRGAEQKDEWKSAATARRNSCFLSGNVETKFHIACSLTRNTSSGKIQFVPLLSVSSRERGHLFGLNTPCQLTTLKTLWGTNNK